MGEVYEAEDQELHERVALKTILPRFSLNDAAQVRFRQEVNLARKVTHPNVCRVFDVFRHPSTPDAASGDGILFVTMELLAGETLAGRLAKSGRLPSAEALPIALQLSDALAAAHAAGIVHRDFKSANVMLVPSEGGGTRAVVMDFGIAHTFAPTSPDSVTHTLTSAGEIVGTPAYMAPEQLEGRTITPATDVYALGLVLYEMLTGIRPFENMSLVEAAMARLRHPPRSGRRFAGGMDRRWARVIDRCLEYDPARRFPAAADVGRALRQKARPGIPRMAAAWVLAVLALAALLMLLYRPVSIRFGGVPSEKHLAVLPFRNIGGDPANELFCDGVVETVTSKLAQLERFQKSFWVVPASESRKIKSLEDAERVLGVTLVVTGSMERLGGVVRVTANLSDAHSRKLLASRTIDATTSELPALEDRVWERVADMLDLQIAPEAKRALAAGGTAVPGAYEYYQQGVGYTQRPGVDNLDRAIGLFQKALEKDPVYALAYAGLGDAYSRKYDLTKDPKLIEEARQHADRALELNDKLPQVLLVAARTYGRAGQVDQAIRYLKRVLEIDPASAEAVIALGGNYAALGRMSDAEEAYRNAISIRPGYWAAYTALGYFYYSHGKFDRAEPLFRTAISLAPDNPINYEDLGGTYLLMGRYNDAISVLTRSIALKETAPALSNLASAYMFQRHFDQAVPLLEKAVKLVPMYDALWRNLGDAYMFSANNSAKAPAAYRKALEIVEARLKMGSSNAATLASAGLYAAKLRQFAEARRFVARSLALGPADNDVIFKSALVYELAGDRSLALAAVQSAWKNGYSLEQIRKEPELDRLRRDPRFAAWIRQVSK